MGLAYQPSARSKSYVGVMKLLAVVAIRGFSGIAAPWQSQLA